MLPVQSPVFPRIALPWIVRLRYAMVAAQLATMVLSAQLFWIELPWRWIIIPPALVVASNLWLGGWQRRPQRMNDSTVIGAMFVLDTLCLTAILMLSGGATNPFSLLYLVHITLAATILTQRQTWGLGVLSIACFALLFAWYYPVPQLGMMHHMSGGMQMHLMGMWAGFAVATTLVAIFSGKLSQLLRQHEQSLLEIQEQLAKRDRLAALLTLAAGAAHELGTPLSTIAVVSKELERYATRQSPDSSVAEDSRLIRTEVERCREILQRMSAQGAEPMGESPEVISVATLLEALRIQFAAKKQIQVMVSELDAALPICVPRRAVQQALAALLGNACDASTAEAAIELNVSRGDASVRFAVLDHGVGMTAETLRHVGEPFFTTKEPGHGMGLGVFLVRVLAERMGGRLTINSTPEVGTTATMELPLALSAKKGTA